MTTQLQLINITIIIWLLFLAHFAAQVLQSVVRSTQQRNDTILVAPPSIGHTRLTPTNGARSSALWHLFVFRIFWSKACPITSSPKPATKWHTEMMDHLNLYIYIYIYIFNTTRPAHCDYNHPHTSTNAHNLYEITNHPHTRSLPHVSTINRHPL